MVQDPIITLSIKNLARLAALAFLLLSSAGSADAKAVSETLSVMASDLNYTQSSSMIYW